MQYSLALNKLKVILWVDFIYSKISYFVPIDSQQLGPRLLIKFLQDAAGKGELDPWDIDVISVIDSCLLYTSDAADDWSCVDLGGRRIIKKIDILKAPTI